MRIPRVGLLAVAAATLTFLALLDLSRHFDFFYDDWDFLFGVPDWSLGGYFWHHNGHWSTVPAVVNRILLWVVGARDYSVYLAVALLFHVISSLLLFMIVRRRSGDLPALASLLLFLIMPRGWENFLWAAGIGHGGAVMFGLVAIYLLDQAGAGPGRLSLASAALLLSLMSSGMGLFFLAAVGVDLALDRQRRSYLPVLVIPGVAYAVWYLLVGRHAYTPLPHSLSAAVDVTVSFLPIGIGATAAGLFGLALRWIPLALAATTAVVATGWTRAWLGSQRIDSRVVGALAGLLAQFILTAQVRWLGGDVYAASPRYIHVAAVFLLLILSDVLRELPWRGLWKLAPMLLVLVVAWNAIGLEHLIASRNDQFQVQATELRIVWLFRNAPGLDRSAAVDRVLMPQVRIGIYIANRERFGSTLPETSRQQLDSLPAGPVNDTIRSAFPLRVSPVGLDPGPGCATIDPDRGYVDLEVPSGSSVLVSTRYPGSLELSLWLLGTDAPGTPSLRQAVASASVYQVQLPDAGQDVVWHLRLQAPPGTSVCPPGPGVRS